jgi:chromosome segregation ATPase
MLSELLPEEKRKIHELEQKISELDHGTSRYSYTDLAFEYDQLSGRISGLDKLLAKEPRSKIDDHRRRLAHLKSSAQHVKLSLDNLGRKYNFYSNLAKQKAELMGNRQGGGDDVVLEMAENGSLSRSSQMIGEYLSVGRETLGELGSQRERLKAVQRRVLDMFNYLGLSNTLMKGIENREYVDKLIVFGGMFVVLTILLVVYLYLRK